MVQMDQNLTLKIADLSRGGSGVGRVDGQVVFVPFSAPGDELTVRVIKKEKRYLEAEIVSIDSPSPLRLTPECSYFQKCGGCTWQHIPYELQWKTKFSGIAHALKRVGVRGYESITPFEIPAENPFFYRNRIQMRSHRGVLGYFERHTRNHVRVDQCKIAHPLINDELKKWTQERILSELGPEEHKIEFEHSTQGVITSWDQKHAAHGFRQVNDEQNQKLKGVLLSWLTGKGPLIDLYGGNGNLSAPFVGQKRRIISVDVSQIGPKPEGIEFVKMPVLSWALKFRGSDIFSTRLGEDARAEVILDPPREGLEPHALEIFKDLRGASKIALISCDPDSFARDLHKATLAGWKLAKWGALDFFPQTPHIESVALLVN